MQAGRKKSVAISIVEEPNEFFKDKIATALEKQRLSVDQNIEFYLVNLLYQFMFAENLYAQDDKGNPREEVLAVLFTTELSAEDGDFRNAHLRRLGDVSLYTAGFFSDSLNRKVVDIDYYIGMGKSAYTSLAQIPSLGAKKHIFSELGKRFHKFVDVLQDVSESTGNKDPQNILRIYELWLKTRSEKAEKSLKEAGIIPNAAIKPGSEQ